MTAASFLLIFEALSVYCLVLGTHSLRARYGLAHFYSLLGGLTAIMSWVTDAGVQVEFAGITFMVGSTVFYTSLILGVFVIYVFDGPQKARVAISTVLGVSILTPVVAALLHWQFNLVGVGSMPLIPTPDFRINSASALTTFVDLLFLGIAWESLGKPRLRIGLWLRTYLTLLAVLMLDVLLFNTGAFLGRVNYLAIMSGTLVSRLAISVFSLPLLYGYLRWQAAKPGVSLENRPVLAILRRFTEMEQELSQAQQEIQRRQLVEQQLENALVDLRVSRERYRQLSEEFKAASLTDALTGIGNRRLFDVMLNKEWKRAVRERTVLSIMMMDIDGFKEFNDQYGHLAGDDALVQIARALNLALRRPADLLVRYGGDEFAAILPRTDSAGAATVAKNCLRHIGQLGDELLRSNGQPLSISIGIATIAPDLQLEAKLLFERADQALYLAKESGGAQFAQAA